MATIGDNVTGILVEKLKERGMWNNTLLVVSGDNGAQPCRSSSYPLKGSKITFFEGGVRSNSFVNGGLLPDAVRGTSLNSFFHVADWYATFLGRAGIDPDDSGEGKFPIDSVDVWPLITGQAKTTSRRYINLGYEYNNQGALLDSYTGNKLIVGPQVRLLVGLKVWGFSIQFGGLSMQLGIFFCSTGNFLSNWGFSIQSITFFIFFFFLLYFFAGL